MGNVEWAINWTPSRDSFTQSYCNTVPTPEGGTHESGFWSAVLKGIKAYGELRQQQESRLNHPRRRHGRRLCIGVLLHLRTKIRGPNQGSPGQRVEAQKWVENSVRDHFDNWLASNNKSAGAILDYMVLKAEERLRRKQEKDTARKSATKKLRLPGKLTDCSQNTREGTELFHRRGRLCGRLGQNGTRP